MPAYISAMTPSDRIIENHTSWVDVYEIADRILVMGQGKLVYDGAVEQAFGTPEIVEKLGLEMPEMAMFREALLPEIRLTARSMAGVIDELRDYIQ